MKIAFLFSGQGAQYVGMGKEIYEQYPIAKEIYDQIEVDFDVKKVSFEGPEEMLQDTAYTQSCIFAHSCAVAAVLKEKGIVPEGLAGLSLGEYGAYAYGSTFSIKDGAKILRERGKLMAHSLPAGTTGMAAVLMLDEDKILQACKEASDEGIVEIANYNCPGQIAITGEKKALEKAMALCSEYGARKVIPLAVSGAFHSSLLKDASIELKQVLDNFDIQPSTLPIYNNISGNVESGDIKDILMKQICNSVYFTQTIEHMHADGFDTFIEVGPGKALSSFVKKTLKGKEVTILNAEDQASIEACVNQLQKGL